ncbi:hypothetical protein ALI22I_12975 [Saccharothrix sp. ALI-22-I]|uniref:alkaline phosphatase family protein n=1 Tax=Saccharothrix sp. ALI-22-I TaxID=1933778 RepID=UPI00097C4F66|nr:alkaline phosphatase family protein [Saccharothrix sp. ALI-22-I]ONI90230.1 hypothetical protein ALI22I_12975 [Saccharothrix sp. ALI-22-I]
MSGSRRTLLTAAVAGSLLPPSVHEALTRQPRPGGLSAIEHVVLLVLENRSFDRNGVLPFHYELADTFTVCDAYHCSAPTSTGPNRDYSESTHAGRSWTTYAERLRDAGKSWRVYQEWGESTASFRADVEAGRLPEVSYLVPSPVDSEHPGASSPAASASLTYQVLDALASVPEVWDSTALFITYDENDGYFDHVRPPRSPRPPREAADEHAGDLPLGLGPRVPMVVVSPWSVGGYVDSQVFDHSSTTRFLERWLGVSAPEISAWQRTVCGDLTSAFDFVRRARRMPEQEPGVRPARPLPYQPDACGVVVGGEVRLALRNSGDESVHLALYPYAGEFEFPVHFDVRSSVDVAVPFGERYRFTVVGPNGFRREFGGVRDESVAVESAVHGHSRVLSVTLANSGTSDVTFSVVGDGRDFKVTVRPGKRRLLPWLTAFRHGWYDLAVSCDGFHRRLAGHVENGRESVSG